MVQFTKKVRSSGRNGLVVYIPKDIVDAYKIYSDDLVTFDIVKVHRDKIRE